jgi:pimeloyl-ACP methyl ester carboxylesterase
MWMSRHPRVLVLFGVLAAGSGCAVNRPFVVYVPPPGPTDIVFVANGSGDYRSTSSALAEAASADSLPLRIETLVWSHGYRRIVVDHLDYDNLVVQGQRLAGMIVAQRQACPAQAVYLVGHSTGCQVILTAAEAAPPGSVERIVLLAPAVSEEYDLRPALRCARQGIDVFTSRRDIGALGVGTGIGGTADRRWSPAAGRVGFAPVVTSPCDQELYARLRIYPWDPCLDWSGNTGGHYGTLKQTYLRTYVMPLLVRRSGESCTR